MAPKSSIWLQNQAKSPIQSQRRNFSRIEKKIKIQFSQMCPKFVLGCLELPVAPSRDLCGPLESSSVAHTTCRAARALRPLPPLEQIWDTFGKNVVFFDPKKVPSLVLNGRSGLDLEPKVDPNTGRPTKSEISALKSRLREL